MPEEKKNAPLNDEELGKVAGGAIIADNDLFPDESIWPDCPRCGTHVGRYNGVEYNFVCPNCGWKA